MNQHGHELLEFLNDSKLCVLNGRITPETDSFTSISRKGKSIVDYICVPHDVLDKCCYFKVFTMQSIIDDHALHGLLGERSTPPDHSVLMTEFQSDNGIQYTTSTDTSCKVK